jgi:hypothetical protein
MNIHIESTYPLWLVLPLVALAIFISWLLYFRKQSDSSLPVPVRIILGISRALAIFLIGLLAISPWIRTHTSEGEKPQFVIALDNSRSMTPMRDSEAVVSDRNLLIEKLSKTLSEKFEVRKVLFGDLTRDGGNWDYSDQLTQAGELAGYLKSVHANSALAGALVVTDGVVTRGPGFLESTRNLRFPLFVLGIGDTLKKRDVAVSEVITNDQVRKNSLFQIRVYFSHEGDVTGGAEIRITQQSGILASKRIPAMTQGSPYVDFEIKAPESGSMFLKAVINPDVSDQNLDNNSRSFTVKVIGEEIHVVAVYGSAHPDIGAIARALEQTPQIGFESFQTEKIKELPEKCDLLILHNLPSKKFPVTNFLEEVRKRSVPLLLIIGSQTDPLSLNPLDGRLSVSGHRRGPEEINAIVSSGFAGFILPEDLPAHLESWPPLEVSFETFNATGGREVLLNQKIRNIELADPLIFFSRFGGGRFGLIAGEGIWRWRMYDQLEFEERQVFDDLLVRMIEYLVAETDNKRFEIRVPGDITEYAPIRLQAILKNRSMEWVNDPDVNLTLTDSSGHATYYQMGRAVNFYELNLNGFPAGKYQFAAETRLGEDAFNESGSFQVMARELEQKEPVADFSGLRLAAALTGGRFFMAGEQDEVESVLKSIDIQNIRSIKKYKWYDLIDLKWILIVIAILLSLEWFLRRWYGTR